MQSPAKHVKVLDAIVTVSIATGIHHANIVENADCSFSTPLIQFAALTDCEANFIFDFGDGATSVPIIGSVQETGFGASAFHRYSKAGDYIIKVIAFNELFTATDEIGPYCVQAAPSDLSIATNSNKVCATLTAGTNVSYLWNIGNQTTYNTKGPEIVTFSSVALYNVTVTAWNKLGRQKAWKVVKVLPRKKPIYITTNGTVFSTETYITFTAVTEEYGPMVFVWQFGDRSTERTVRRVIMKRFTVPNRYDVIVNASNQLSSFTSDTHTIFVQKKVIPNRLVASSSVLINSSVSFNCRINSGTNASYLWNFGDGIERPGSNNDTHVFTREGEYTVKVFISNNVSAAFLTKPIFVVKESCHPPPVKNMGPLKIQIKRHEELRLAVTFEAAILCNISLGLSYHWSLVKSNGSVIPLPPHIDNDKPTIALPAFFLSYGNYTAVTRVQIIGNVVYSNYTVSVEVQPSDPVSAFSSGHHFFIDRTTVKYFTLNGTQSFDPDNPGAHLRFHWSCVAVCTHGQLCFDSSALNPLHKNDSVIIFPTVQLSDNCDQFHFTLIVSNGDRKSSAAEASLSISPNTNFKSVEMTCIECRGHSINYNQQFSLRAVCADCSNQNDISYQWSLYQINATETSISDVPFCRLKESMGAPRPLSENNVDNGTSSKVTTSEITLNVYPTNVYGESQIAENLRKSELSKLIYGNTESLESVHDLPMMELSESNLDLLDEGSTAGRDIMSLWSTTSDTDLDYKVHHIYKFTDFDTHFFGNIVEDVGGSGTRSGSEFDYIYGFSDEYTATHTGDNFVDLSFSTPNISPMVHWLKLPIRSDVFSSYTTSGISSQTIIIRPFFLKPSKMYMVDVSLELHGYKIGRSQLYFKVNEMSHKMSCHVQPKSGSEVFTVFSVFCTSGKEDLSYEFSYQAELSKKILYKGRDIQYYFNLPSGDPARGYQVTVFTQITNLYGSQTQPCQVNVTVLPIVFHNTSGNSLMQPELFQESLKNLSALILMGSHIEIRNYVVLLTTVLNRLYMEGGMMSFELHSEIRNRLIFIVQGLAFNNQDELSDIISMLRDLFNATNQVTVDSAMLIINYTQSIVQEKFVSTETGKHKGQKKLVENIIFLISNAVELHSGRTEGTTMFEKGMKCISDLILKFITSTSDHYFTVGTNFLELQTSVHQNVHNNIERINSSTFYLPKILDSQNWRQNTSIKCYISQLTYFKKNPYFWAKLPSEVNGDFTSLGLFDCPGMKKLSTQDILTPVIMETENNNQVGNVNKTQYILFRDKINFHQFSMIPKNKHSALKITVSFSKHEALTFPVLLLIRHSKKPSPTSFNVKEICSSEELSTRIFIPADSLRGAEYSYMALMDADYRRHPKNKYISNKINYTVDVQWTRCLYWNNKHWDSDDCSPQKGHAAAGFTCSCTHIGLYTTASTHVSSHFYMEDISQFLSTTKNLVPPIIVAICALLYTLLMFCGKIKDQCKDPKDRFVFLQDNSSSHQQQYAIMIDVGFRSRPKTTAKVHLILHGKDAVSETRELYCPDKPLFERNSRHTFIMSVPESLGPLWKIHIWHNNNGYSPSLYLSHVIVKDLQSGASWFFYAECWLAIDEGDGKVERELMPVGHGLGFRRLFYCKFTEYLEDFHLWGSVFSQPSYSWFSHTQRITTCFVLLLGYMCLNVLLIHGEEEQYTVEIGLIEISTVSMTCGLKATLALYPVVVLLSLLFRFSQKKFTKDSGENRFKVVKGSQIYTTEGHQHSVSAEDAMFESNLTWQHFQYWANEAWKKKYERDFSTSSFDIESDTKRFNSQLPSVSTQGSSGFEDYNSNSGRKTGLKKFKDCENRSCSQYSLDHSLFENSLLHGKKVLPPWCAYVAWTVCAMFSLICVVIIVAFGFRFGPTKCVLWLHAMFFSLIYCIFIIQPFLILLLALFVSWHKRKKTDFFLEALSEDVKYIVGRPGLSVEHITDFDRESSHETTNFEKILAARKRSRYLRLARPPTPAQLKITKDKLRRKTIIGKMFRELTVYIIMAFMLIFIIIGKYSQNEYYVNHAVRNEFTRNPKQPFSDIRTEDHWWNYCFNVLLDGLYWNKLHYEKDSHNVGPLEGKFYMIGAPLLRKLDVAYDSACMSSSFSTSDFPGCTSSHLPNGARDKNGTIKIPEQKLYRCGKIQCYEENGSVIHLGRSRAEAASSLWNARNQQWIDRKTRAFIVEFLLYNPPTNLFTMVSLLTELPASGDIITSSHIDSVTIYRTTTLTDYFIMKLELMYLGMVFIYFYLQLNTMIQRGIRNYWQESWNWLEASIIVLSLSYYGCQIYHFMVTVNIRDHLQRGFFKVFINFSFIAAVETWTRCLHRIILFLMMNKFIKLLRFYKMMAPWVVVLQHSCCSSAFTVLIAIVFTVAFSSLGHLIFFSQSYLFCSLLNSIKTIIIHLPGVRGIKHIKFFQNHIKANHISTACFYGALFLAFTLLWTGMRKGILTAVAKYSKKAQCSKHLVTFKEFLSHAKRLVLSILGHQRQKNTDGICITSTNYYLDEFEDLIDELLFRLNAISNSRHHSLPIKSQYYTEEGDTINSDTSSDFSFQQTVMQVRFNLADPTVKFNKFANSIVISSFSACSDVSGINLNGLSQSLESAYRNGCNNPEEASKLNCSDDTMDPALENKQCIIKIEDEHELSVRNVRRSLDTSQCVCAAREEKAVLSLVLYIEQCENAIIPECNTTDSKTCSANKHMKTPRALRPSHTTVTEPLETSTTDVCSKPNGHGSKASGTLNNGEDLEQPQCNTVPQSFCDIVNVTESTHGYVETVTRTPHPGLAKDTVIKKEDKTPPHPHAGASPCPVRQCW
ncbi:Polycystic kidney disease [Pristimantis euphronides]